MFLAMNRFRVVKGQEAAFEALWTGRKSHLAGVPGFRSFQLLRGEARDTHTLYASHSVWDSEDAFRAWTRSDAFRLAHKDAGGSGDLYLEAPVFEGFAAVSGAETLGETG